MQSDRAQKLIRCLAAAALLLFVCAAGVRKTAAPFDGKHYLRASTPAVGAVSDAQPLNPYPSLSVPTAVSKTDGLYFIVDCYHDQIIYHDNLSDPLSDWHVMTSDISRGHTLASDGLVYLADDTENHRVLVLEKRDGRFLHTQTFDNIGVRPHDIAYDEATDTFYCWSSQSGEMYLFRHRPGDSRMYLTQIRAVPALSQTYVRSFTIRGDDIYFVSGLPVYGSYTDDVSYTPSVLVCDLRTFRMIKKYPVPDEFAGMAQVVPIENYFYITVSTDVAGSQDAATLLRVRSLDDLQTGDCEVLYDACFIGGGTPYRIDEIDGKYYLTEHRINGHALWQFDITDDEIRNIVSLY